MKIYHIGLNAGTNDGLEISFKKIATYRWVNTSDHNLNSKVVSDCNEFKPDLVFIQVQSPNILRNETITKIKPSCGNIFNFTGDVRDPLPSWYLETGKLVDLTLFVSMTDVIKTNGIINSNWIQIGFDDSIFNDKITPAHSADIVFMANNYGSFPLSDYRKEIVNTMSREFKGSFEVIGSGWGNTRNLNASLHAQAAIYRGCKIAINCSHYNHHMYSSDRILRIMGSGAMCLSQEFKGWDNLYGNHLSIFNGTKDLVDKCRYYLNSQEERTRIARSGYEFTHTLFTWDQFVKNLMYYHDL